MYAFLIRNGIFKKDTFVSITAYTLLALKKRMGFSSELSAKIKMWRKVNLNLKKTKINCRTGHIGLIEENFLKRNLDLGNGDVIDCGANIGLFTLANKDKIKSKVICVEPDSGNLEFLKNNLKINGINNAIIEEKAISDKEGEAIFTMTECGVGSFLGEGNKKNEIKTKVKLTTIDSITRKHKLNPSFIKIDIEGQEIEALKGMKDTLNSFSPTVFIEIHKEEYEDMIYSFLRDFGYTDFKKCVWDGILCNK